MGERGSAGAGECGSYDERMSRADAYRLTLDAPAKVNLALSVGPPTADGYHPLESVFCALDLCDTLCFEMPYADVHSADARPDAARTTLGTPVAISLAGPCAPGVDVPVADNLVFRVVDAFEQVLGRPVVDAGRMLAVSIDKHIPAGGGLGGGSSDAACALRACAQMAASGEVDLDVVARSIGADVAFFLHGGTALMTGRGDVLSRRLPTFPLPLVLMGDAGANPTGEVYAAYDELSIRGGSAPQEAACGGSAPQEAACGIGTRGSCDPSALADALDAGESDPRRLASLCGNDLDPAAMSVNGSLASRMRRAADDPDVLAALVTGSGSTTYALCADAARAAAFAERARAWSTWTRVATPT